MADNTKPNVTPGKLIGVNYTTPDIVAKVTGKAKYAEDYRAEGMLWTKLLLSPMPHARIVSIDTSAALAMPGVKAIITADDLPDAGEGGTLGEGVQASTQGERILTKEPAYEGEPILALAAVDEITAAEAIEKIVVQFEPLPFAVDPIQSLRPGSPSARTQGNTWARPQAPPAAAPAAAGAAAAPAAAPAAQAAAPAAAAAAAPQAGGRRGGAAADGAAGAGGDGAAGAGGRGGRGPRGAGAPAGDAPAAAAAGAAGAAAGAGAGRGARGARGAGGPAGAAAAAPARPEIQEWKWTAEDFAEGEKSGQMPQGKPTDEWTFGDIEEGFKQADLVLEETFVSQSTGHQPLETRSAMAYWQNGKLFLHGSTQSTVQTVGSVARWVSIRPADVVFVSEYTGGGFGSKIPGSISMAIPALLSKKANAPVMMRITREDEHYIGRARPGIHSRIKVGFRKDGRITAIDLYTVGDNGPYEAQGDYRSAGSTVSLCYQPLNMRWRGITVLTNTPPRTSQRAPGGMQAIGLMEPMMSMAARKLGLDEVEIHRINAPAGKAKFGPPAARGQQAYVTSSFVKEALDKGREVFNWDEKKARSGKRVGNKVRGAGVAVSAYSGGSIGFDGLFIIKPDGRVQFQSGIGNHGTHSVIDVHRVAAEMIGVPWEQCDIVWGDTSKNLPWTSISAGSQTTHAMTRAAHAAATDCIQKLQEIAAKARGGNAAAYKVAGGRVSGPGGSMTLAQAAQKAIELGGKYDGHELPADINAFTKTSAAKLAGLGLMAVAKDNYPHDGQTQSYAAGFAEVEVDLETGKWQILEFAAIADVGIVINPRSLQGQTFGGIMLGIGHAHGQKWVYDQHYGVPLAKRFYSNRPPTILDKPLEMKFAAVGLADPETPVGARGVGEPPVGAGYGAVMNAIAAAVGDEVFRRSPVTADIILMALENGGKRQHEQLTAHI
ncbi:MAG: xanthine dehydrogenase family protein molybdopterin-binding subunit [Acidobacteriaceae bacterium]|jgi:CO/xanthine dehydrogenase Mo-binding subunit|nr:xanthine dehydrogenase family protein molybdopterin-binding subunit [Acidobacteriaceae bacterium]